MKARGRARGGGSSGSESRGWALTSLDGSGSATSFSTEAPHVKPFPLPSTVEPLFKHLKEMSSQRSKQKQHMLSLALNAATNSPTLS